MSERGSSIERVVGGIDDEDKQDIQQQYEDIFRQHEMERLTEQERLKTPEEQQIVGLVDEATNAVRKKYGLDVFSIPEANVHVIKAESWKTGRAGAAFLPRVQGIALRETDVRAVFAKKLFHEMIHFKSYGAAQVRQDTQNVDLYRQGLRVYPRAGDAVYFRLLNEAVTEELTRRWCESMVHYPLFEQEIKDTEQAKQRLGKAASAKKLKNVFYLSEETHKEGDGYRTTLRMEEFTYQKERRVLVLLADKIAARNSEHFQSAEQVFDLFAQAMLDGNLLSLGKTIDKTFGKGTFRAIGEARDAQALRELVDGL